MLIEFTVGNYCSFRDPATLSMVAAKLRSRDKSLDQDNVYSTEGQPALLASVALYGANASGKSNLIGAMHFMRAFVLESSEGTDSIGGISVDPFRLNQRTAQQPSHFEVAFVLDGQRYRYGFEVTDQRVVCEWLYTVPKRTEALLFERRPDRIKLGPTFREGRGLEERIRPNALFLSVAAQFNGPVSQAIVGWFRRLRIVSGLADMGMRFYTERKLTEGKDVHGIVGLITRLDLGITDVRVETTTAKEPPLPPNVPENFRLALETIMRHSKENRQRVDIKTMHTVYDDSGQETGTVEFDLDSDESAGTRKLFSMAGPLINTLTHGHVMLVDELDARLHSTLTREIIKLFNSLETNPKHAQLIFTTQDTNLLDNALFRRDQIWFVEKDSKGTSHLYSLAEFKGVRNDLSLERNYIQGRLGAVPYVEDLPAIVKESQASYGAQAK